MATENNFPTLRDLRDKLNQLVDMGLGDQPAQVVVVPDSTLQAVALASAPEGYVHDKPALMVEFDGIDGRLPILVLSTERMQKRGMPSLVKQ